MKRYLIQDSREYQDQIVNADIDKLITTCFLRGRKIESLPNIAQKLQDEAVEHIWMEHCKPDSLIDIKFKGYETDKIEVFIKEGVRINIDEIVDNLEYALGILVSGNKFSPDPAFHSWRQWLERHNTMEEKENLTMGIILALSSIYTNKPVISSRQKNAALIKKAISHFSIKKTDLANISSKQVIDTTFTEGLKKHPQKELLKQLFPRTLGK